MGLPEGRKALTDGDMIILLHNMARSVLPDNETLHDNLRETANRFSELSKQEKNESTRY